MRSCKLRQISLIIIIAFAFILSGCDSNETERTEQQGLETNFIEIDNQRFTTILESDNSYFIYIGRPTCPICRELEPILENVLSNIDMTLYYYNTDEARQENYEIMVLLLDSLEIMSVPTIIYINNGEIVEELNGIQEFDDLLSFFNNR